MNWQLIRPALAAAIVQMTGLDPRLVVWKGTLAERSQVIGTRVVLSTNSVVSVGIDETRREGSLNPLDDAMVTITGVRQFTWTVMIEAQNQGVGDTARELIETVRTRMGRQSTIDALGTVGIGLANDLAVTHTDYLESGRMVSMAALDMLMNAVENDDDDTVDAGGWIGEVDVVSGLVKDTDGTTLGTITEEITG